MNFRDLFRKTQNILREFRSEAAKMKRAKQAVEEEFMKHEVLHTKHEPMKMEVSSSTIARFFGIALLFLAGVWFLYTIREIVLIFFVALLFAAALDPIVDRLEHRRIPRWVGIIIVYIVFFFLLGLFIGNLIPLLASEISDLALKIQDLLTNIANGNISLPSFLEGLRPTLKKFFSGVDVSKIGSYREILIQFGEKLASVGKNVVNALILVFNGIFNTALVLVLTFLMTIDEKAIDKFILSLFPARYGTYIMEKSRAIKDKVGYWLRGQISLMIIVGFLVALGFFVVGLFTTKIQYAATIAMFAGLMELIPYVGAVLAWLIALPIVANQSLILVIWVTVVFVIVQQLENNFIVPLVMKKAVGLNPILSIFSLMVGFKLLGVLGMVLAIPVATTVSIFVKDYAQREK